MVAEGNAFLEGNSPNSQLVSQGAGAGAGPSDILNYPGSGLGSNALMATNKVNSFNQPSGPLIDILTASGKKTKQETEILYLVSVQFEGDDQNWYEDCQFLNVYRIAFLKSMPIYKLRINSTQIILNKVKNDINDNKKPKLTMKISSMQTIEGQKVVSSIFEKKFVITHIEPKTNEIITRGTSVTVEMVLVNPVLFDMSTKFSYNKTFKSKTAYEILQDYEGYINSTYGDSFQTKHIINEKNEFKYSQLIIQPSNQKIEFNNGERFELLTTNDAAIPLFLQYKYKIDHAFGFYFYDDFNIKEKKEIVRYFITFYDRKKFETFDTTKHSDIIDQTTMGKSYPFHDMLRVIDKEEPVMSYRLPNDAYETEKKQKHKTETSTTTTKNEVQITNNERKYQENKVSNKTKQHSQSGEYITLQVPDNKDLAKKRLQMIQETMKNVVDRIDEFSTSSCAPDWLQFGICYALNPGDPSDTKYTPIAIVNCFNRVHQKELSLSHFCRYMMLRFKKEEPKKVQMPQPIAPEAINKNLQASPEEATAKVETNPPAVVPPVATTPPPTPSTPGPETNAPSYDENALVRLQMKHRTGQI